LSRAGHAARGGFLSYWYATRAHCDGSPPRGSGTRPAATIHEESGGTANGVISGPEARFAPLAPRRTRYRNGGTTLIPRSYLADQCQSALPAASLAGVDAAGASSEYPTRKTVGPPPRFPRSGPRVRGFSRSSNDEDRRAFLQKEQIKRHFFSPARSDPRRKAGGCLAVAVPARDTEAGVLASSHCGITFCSVYRPASF